MNITRKSLISGKLHTLDLPVTEAQLRAYADGALLQDAFPDLAAPLREFIKTGVTPEEWEARVLGIDMPEGVEVDDPLQADSEIDDDAYYFLEVIWHPALDR
jgi:hypothetical protein